MRRYRVWAGNEAGVKEDPKHCAAAVSDGGRSCLTHQCRRERGYGIGEYQGLLCWQHALQVQNGLHLYVPKEDR